METFPTRTGHVKVFEAISKYKQGGKCVNDLKSGKMGNWGNCRLGHCARDENYAVVADFRSEAVRLLNSQCSFYVFPSLHLLHLQQPYRGVKSQIKSTTSITSYFGQTYHPALITSILRVTCRNSFL